MGRNRRHVGDGYSERAPMADAGNCDAYGEPNGTKIDLIGRDPIINTGYGGPKRAAGAVNVSTVGRENARTIARPRPVDIIRAAR